MLAQFGIATDDVSVIPINQGLINHTWKIQSAENAYILQQINRSIFKKPEDVAHNIAAIASYLHHEYPGYIFTAPLATKNGQSLYTGEDGNSYRMFPFIKNSHTKISVETAAQAKEAASQFGRFTAVLKNFNAADLKITIPFFHDLSLRYDQFLLALNNGNASRITAAAGLIQQLKNWSHIAAHFETIKKDPSFKLRVTHHDTKISNVLFDKNDKGICVIDLDTVMPGYFISDVGDMMRTYLSPVTEEEQDLDKIKVRPEIYNAIVQGYLQEMKDELSETEKSHIFYAGSFMIYMQALRFLTDHLNDDVYYGAAYKGHNYIRAANQAALLQQFMGLKDTVDKTSPVVF